MAKAGQEIYNPVQGDRIVFRKTAQEARGEVLGVEVIASPQAVGPPTHVHPLQEELFERARSPSINLVGRAWLASRYFTDDDHVSK